MKKLNKKGFTIVELVIVIAVIAILAAVLIPTYSSVVDKANESAALQKAKNAYTALLVFEDGDIANDVANTADAYISVENDKYWYQVKDGKLTKCAAPDSGSLKTTAQTTETYDAYWLQVAASDLPDVSDDVKVYIYTPGSSST